MNTISTAPSVPQRRRKHSDEFKADAVAAATRPGVSVASVALARGVNANLLRRWIQESQLSLPQAMTKTVMAPSFVPVQPPPPIAAGEDIRIEVRRGATTVTVAWPVAAAPGCASWLRELLR